MSLITYLYATFRFNVLFPLHLAVAAAVTVHALLYKRDVGAALGLDRPVVARTVRRRLPLLRRGHQPRAAARAAACGGAPAPATGPRTSMSNPDDDLEPLQRGVGRISRRPLEDRQCVRGLSERRPKPTRRCWRRSRPHSARSDCRRTSSAPTRTACASSRRWRRRTSAASRSAVIIDGIGGNWILSWAYRALRRRGVPAARFMHSPWPWRMPLLNLRSHKKILVVDGRIGFTGGHEHPRRQRDGDAPEAPGGGHAFQGDRPPSSRSSSMLSSTIGPSPRARIWRAPHGFRTWRRTGAPRRAC